VPFIRGQQIDRSEPGGKHNDGSVRNPDAEVAVPLDQRCRVAEVGIAEGNEPVNAGFNIVEQVTFRTNTESPLNQVVQFCQDEG